MEKAITLSEIQAKFTKNFDTFGYMEPFLVFKLGQSEDKTEVFDDKSLNAKWVKIITLKFSNQQNLQIKGYDEDMTENQYMGTAIVPIKTFSKSGKHTVEMLGEDQKSIGSITFKYQITGLFQPQTQKIQASQKPVPVSQKSIPQPQPKPVVQQVKPKIIQKPQLKPVELMKEVAEQKPKAEKAPVEVVKKQEINPVEPKEFDRNVKQDTKPAVPKESDRNQKKLTELSQKEIDKKSINLNNSTAQLNKSLNRSRQSLKLPSIVDTSKNYGDKIYDKQSSATLQKSILVYSMPKASRFHSGPKYIGEPSYYVDSCFKPNSTKGVGFGFGSKRQFPEWMERNMKENPAPGAYFEQSKLTSVRSKGPTFGISYKYYEKVTIPTEKSPERVTRSNQRLKPIIRSK